MKDENDKSTNDIFPEEQQKFLKGKNKDFQRLHIEKIVKGGTKNTTVSIETLSYEFLALKLEAIPHTREANKIIKKWLLDKMKEDIKNGTLDLYASYDFSSWLKKAILWEIVSKDLDKKYWLNIDKYLSD